jgi:3-isopropylmalate/(R)-2-methylmalate dehydratase large subunit
MTAQSMFDKIWRAHEVVPESAGAPAILYIDLHLTHEVTSPQAFAVLRARGLRLRRPDRTLATLDHATPTDPRQVFGGVPIRLESAARQIHALEQNAAEFGVELLGLRDSRRGIVHVIGPELGLTQPGMTIACGDSHTSTHGAFGTFAFGIGTTEVGLVFATSACCPRRRRSRSTSAAGSAGHRQDLVLAIIGLGVAGGTSHVIEYRGPAIRALSMDERMTVCNMSIEAGARAGMIAPDATTFDYLRGCPRAPAGADWERAIERWRALASDAGSTFDRQLDFDASAVEPMISYGTNPGMVMPIGGRIPLSDDGGLPEVRCATWDSRREALAGCRWTCLHRQLHERAPVGPARRRGCCRPPRRAGGRHAGGTGLAAGEQARGGRACASVPGAGAEWRESGCSMCVGINGDTAGAGRYVVSTSNRNFEGRQGQGARTLLASPATAAAAAITGRITDPREFAV